MSEALEKARATYQSNLREPFQNLRDAGILEKEDPRTGPRLPLSAAEQVQFQQNFAPTVRQYGLEATVQMLLNKFDGPGAYSELRLSGLNDLDILQNFLNIEKISLPIASRRQEGLSQDDIVQSFVEDLGLDVQKDLLNKGIDPEELLKTFVVGRDLTPREIAMEGTARGITVGGPSMAGLAAGATLMAPVAPPFGPIAGGLLGLVTLGAGGVALEEAIFPDEPILDPGQAALMEGFKVFGEGLTGTPLPRTFRAIQAKALDAQEGFFNTLGQSIRQRSFNLEKNPLYDPDKMSAEMEFLQTTNPVLFKWMRANQDNPRLFATIEGLGITGAAAGAGIAELVDPGDPLTRGVFEVGAGLTAQTGTRGLQYILPGLDALKADGAEVFKELGSDSKTARVGTALQELLRLRGEDPEEIIRRVTSPEFDQLLKDATEAAELSYERGTRPLLEGQEIPAPTARALSASPTLSLIEGRLRAKSGEFGTRIQNELDRQNEAVSRIITLLTMSGGKESLRTAGLLRQARFEELLERRLAFAIGDAQKATRAIKTVNPTTKMEASKKIDRIIGDAFNEVRQQESRLYDLVPKSAVVDQTNFINAIQAEQATNTEEVLEATFPKMAAKTEAKFSKRVKLADLQTEQDRLRRAYQRLYVAGPSPDQSRVQEVLAPLGLRTREALDTEISSVNNQIKDLMEEVGERPTFEQMANYRSTLLTMAKDAASGENPNQKEARVYGRLAQGIAQDLADIERLQELNPQLTADDLQAASTARSFSKALNDVFRRAFPNETLRDKATGADFVHPELIYQKIKQGDDAASEIRMRELDDAVAFLADPKVPGATTGRTPEEIEDIKIQAQIDSADLNRAYDEIFRSFAIQPTLIDPESGEIKPAALSRFIENNQLALDRLPQLRRDLENARSAQILVDKARTRKADLERRTAFELSKVTEQLTGQRPVAAIKTILRGTNPEQGVINLVQRLQNAAKRSEAGQGPFAEDLPTRKMFVGDPEDEDVRGELKVFRPRPITVDQVNAEIRDAFFAAARDFAKPEGTSIDAAPNFRMMRSFFFDTRDKNPPLISTLVNLKVFEPIERTRLRELLIAGEGAQKKIANPNFDIESDIETGTDVLTGLLVRIGGAEGGSRIAGMFGGRPTGLIERTAGSQAAMKLLRALPVTTVDEILEKAIEDPEQLKLLLSKEILKNPKTRRERNRQLFGQRQLNLFFKQALGINLAEYLAEEPLTEEEQGQIRTFEQQGPFPPVSEPQAMAPLPGQMPAPPLQGAPNPQQRQQFAALFPNDPISGLIQQQGIASLPQARG